MSDATDIVNNHPSVKEAGLAITDSIGNIKACEQAIIDAQAALDKANAKCDAASHTDDPQTLVDNVEQCDLTLRRAKVALRVAQSQKQSAIKAHASAAHVALDGFYAEARAKRLAACKEIDAANTQLREAMVHFAQATISIRDAHNAGRVRPFDDSLLGPQGDWGVMLGPVSSAEQSELALWA